MIVFAVKYDGDEYEQDTIDSLWTTEAGAEAYMREHEMMAPWYVAELEVFAWDEMKAKVEAAMKRSCTSRRYAVFLATLPVARHLAGRPLPLNTERL